MIRSRRRRMFPAAAARVLYLMIPVLAAACQSVQRIEFVPIDSKVRSSSPTDGWEGDSGAGQVRVSWRVQGLYREGESDPGPEIIVSLTCRNRTPHPFILEQESLRILDDEGRPLLPDITDADRSAALACDPGATVTMVIPFRPEGEIALEKVASIRIYWSYRLGKTRREMETKFFRRSMAMPQRPFPSFGIYSPYWIFPP